MCTATGNITYCSVFFDSNREDKRFCTEWRQVLPEFNQLLISSFMQLCFVSVFPKYIFELSPPFQRRAVWLYILYLWLLAYKQHTTYICTIYSIHSQCMYGRAPYSAFFSHDHNCNCLSLRVLTQTACHYALTQTVCHYAHYHCVLWLKLSVTACADLNILSRCALIRSLETCQPEKQQRCANCNFSSCCFSSFTQLDDTGGSVFILDNETVPSSSLYVCYPHFDTFKTILIVQLTFPPRRCFHLIVVRRFEYASDPESYTSGSVATGRASLAGQVKG